MPDLGYFDAPGGWTPDAAWRTRLPPGWITFPDGSIGPPNQTGGIDDAWRTRVPPSGKTPGLTLNSSPAASPPAPASDVAGNSLGPAEPTQLPGATAPSPAGAAEANSGSWDWPSIRKMMPGGGRAQINSPGGQTTIDYSPGSVFSKLRGMIPGLGGAAAAAGPAAIPALAAGGAIAGVPATQKWNATTDDPFLMDPNNAGGIPGWFGPQAPQNYVRPEAPQPAPSYPSWPTPGPGGSTPTGSPSATPRPARYDPLSSAQTGRPVRSPAAAPPAAPQRRPGAPNLGYYQGRTGNARGAQWTQFTNPNDPRIYRG